MCSLKRKITLWWRFEGKYIPSNTIKGFKNLLNWSPIIWKIRDYNYESIYLILEKKLNDQASYFKDKSDYLNGPTISKTIKLAAKLCELLRSNVYLNEYLDYFEQETKFIPNGDGKTFILEINKTYENFDVLFAKHKALYRKIIKEKGLPKTIDDKHMIAILICEQNHIRTRKLLFYILNTRLETWY